MPTRLLLFSYAFSVWMLVDAHKRGAQHYWYLIIFFPFGEWVYFFLIKIHDFKGGLFSSGSDLRCKTCRYCVRLNERGVTCRYSGRPNFKKNIHVGHCPEYHER